MQINYSDLSQDLSARLFCRASTNSVEKAAFQITRQSIVSQNKSVKFCTCIAYGKLRQILYLYCLRQTGLWNEFVFLVKFLAESLQIY